MKKSLWSIPILALVLVLAAQPAGATLNIALDTGNVALAGYVGPFADVAVDLLNATTARLTFTSRVFGGNIYLLGDGSSVAANFNGAATLSAWSASNSGTGFSPGPLSDGGAGNVDGFNTFSNTVNSFDGFSHSSDTIVVEFTKNSGTWTSENDILTANADGYRVAAHIFVTASPADASNGALVTGYATEGGGYIPEPASVLILGLGLFAAGGMGLVRRRRK